MKIIGLDIGKARIGVASCDELGIIASGLTTIYCQSLTKDVLKVVEIVNNYKVNTLVVGLPLQMDGNEGEMAKYVHLFCSKIKEYIEVNIILVDERLSSIEAGEYLHEAKTKKNKKKGVLDQVAASIILQNYLDNKEIYDGK